MGKLLNLKQVPIEGLRMAVCELKSALEDTNEALRAALAAMKAVEWGDPIICDSSTCPSCCRRGMNGHAHDCQLAESIKRVEGVLGE